MVVWSQVGIVGYLLGPLLGGAVAEHFGYGAIGLLPAAAGVAVLILVFASRATTVGAARRSPSG
jgi:MFS family permease